jgi:hypothetical protein
MELSNIGFNSDLKGKHYVIIIIIIIIIIIMAVE